MSLFHILVTIILIFLTAGSFYLGASQQDTKKSLKQLSQEKNQTSSDSKTADSDSQTTTSDSAFSLLEEPSSSLQASISSLLFRIENLEKTDQTTPTPAPVPVYQGGATPSFQPQTIYMGSASTTNTTWTDSGVEVSLYSGDYPSGVKLYFEAGLSIIGGEAWARVKNKTTGSVINTTAVFHNNNTVTWKYSPAFYLHSGNNVYVIQLKSTSSERANLAGARLKITQ